MKKHRNFFSFVLIVVLILPSLVLNLSSYENPPVVRLNGRTRVETSIKVSQTAYSDNNSKNVILTGYKGESDALTGTLLASVKDAPLLIINHLDDAVKEELARLNAQNIYLLGGKQVISESIALEIENLGYHVIRIAGKDRFGTAVAVANEVDKQIDHVFLANDGRSGSLADALAAGPASGRYQTPILLTAKNKLTQASLDAIMKMEVTNVTIVGGTEVISKHVEKKLKMYNLNVTRIAGKGRWETAEKIAQQYFSTSKQAIVVSDGHAETFADALLGGYLGAKENTPILLTKTDSLNKTTKNYLKNHTNFRYILGGKNVITEGTLGEISYPAIETPKPVEGPYGEHVLNTARFNLEFLDYVNRERTSQGAPPLNYLPELQYGVDTRLDEMIAVNDISHTRPNGETWHSAFTYVNNIGVMGENIASDLFDSSLIEAVEFGQRSVENVLAERFFYLYRWSPGHYQNMMNAQYNSIAVASKITPKEGKMFNAMILAKKN